MAEATGAGGCRVDSVEKDSGRSVDIVTNTYTG